MADPALITLTTDFGYSDPYVGALKGVILSLAPEARVVDLSHGVAPFDLLDGAFTLAQACPYYPNGAIHLVVVDPGVGTARRPILARVGSQFFVAPDNGVLSLIYDRSPERSVYHLTARHYFAAEVSDTFQGRDIFAPVAAWLAKGVAPERFGDPIEDYTRFALPKPRREGDALRGVILRADRFGNLITNFTRADLPGLGGAEPRGEAAGFELRVGKAVVADLRRDYAEAPAGRLFAVWGSAGFLEISANRVSALKLSGAERGGEVVFARAGAPPAPSLGAGEAG